MCCVQRLATTHPHSAGAHHGPWTMSQLPKGMVQPMKEQLLLPSAQDVAPRWQRLNSVLPPYIRGTTLQYSTGQVEAGVQWHLHLHFSTEGRKLGRSIGVTHAGMTGQLCTRRSTGQLAQLMKQAVKQDNK